jgi:hypothetical protein
MTSDFGLNKLLVLLIVAIFAIAPCISAKIFSFSVLASFLRCILSLHSIGEQSGDWPELGLLCGGSSGSWSDDLSITIDDPYDSISLISLAASLALM